MAKKNAPAQAEAFMLLKFYQFLIAFFTITPEGVRLASVQLPVALLFGVRAEAPSALSFKAQLAWLMLLVFKKFNHAAVSTVSTSPAPLACTVPHSVTNKAMP